MMFKPEAIVRRVLVYKYDDVETMETDMARWTNSFSKSNMYMESSYKITIEPDEIKYKEMCEDLGRRAQRVNEMRIALDLKKRNEELS